jgi:RimJ/RimL family protein N-acetyltransferase
MLVTATDLVLMPVTRFDRERLADLFARMSRESRYARFLHPKPRMTDAELDYFSDVDHRRHDALAAVDPRGGAFVGVARYATLDDAGTSADLAFEVADAWQGRGVATMLLGALIPRAEGNGVEHLIALTLSENVPARRLLARFGFRKVETSHGVTELRLQLQAHLRLAA